MIRPTVVLVALAACSPESDPTYLTQTGAALSVDYYGNTDVVGMHFEVTAVSCEGDDDAGDFFLEANVDLADGVFPGMIEHVETSVDPESRHLGANFFMSLPAGCYDILAVPASQMEGDEWLPSEDCSSAESAGVQVHEGQTTTVPPMMSQCAGDPYGNLDVLVLLNHPPHMELVLEQSSNYECETVEVCALITDVDDDPVEVEWLDESLMPVWDLSPGELEVVGFEAGHRVWQACAEITTRYTTSYELRVSAYDLVGEDRIEDLLEEESHHAYLFPLFTNWAEEPMCIDGSGEAVLVEGVSIERAEGCSYTDAETYYCSGAYGIDEAVESFLCDEGELVEENLYPTCD
ncbi:MAG: hypothetical protein KTR31_09460 [Myxococcales bacterium]|nr:hypothetical protein [Myxococcales bacterium]